MTAKRVKPEMFELWGAVRPVGWSCFFLGGDVFRRSDLKLWIRTLLFALPVPELLYRQNNSRKGEERISNEGTLSHTLAILQQVQQINEQIQSRTIRNGLSVCVCVSEFQTCFSLEHRVLNTNVLSERNNLFPDTCFAVKWSFSIVAQRCDWFAGCLFVCTLKYRL